jgi:hypothetical protein
MNYTTITINDTKIGLKFGMASFRYLQSRFIEGIAFNDDGLNEIGISHIIYSGYFNNCLIKDVDPSLSFGEIVDWIESNLKNEEALEEVKKVVNLWSESDFIKKTQTETQEQPKKKTSRGKK